MPTALTPVDRLKQALDDTSIFGITTNQGFLERLIDLPATRKATFYTRHPDVHDVDQLVDKTKGLDTEALALAAYFWITRRRARSAQSVAVARHDRLAHGGRRRGIVADTDPPSEESGAGADFFEMQDRDRRQPVVAGCHLPSSRVIATDGRAG